jgi:hypothetical protein
MVGIQTPDGRTARWAMDERSADNVPSNLSFSTTIPGGFEQMAVTLARTPDRDYPDLTEFSTLTVEGVGGQVAWQGRLETAPRASGEQVSITPGAVGFQAALDDNGSARQIYLDTNLTAWQPSSVALKLSDALGGRDLEDPAVVADASTGQPSLATQMTGPWARTHAAKAWYDARGISIGALYYAWKINSPISPADTNWSWLAALSNDDIQTGIQLTSNLRAAGPGTGTLTASDDLKKFALADLEYAIAGGNSGEVYSLFWTFLGIVGNSGVPIQGALTATGGIGVLASDVIGHAVSTWAPQLATTRNGVSTIEPTTVSIPQLAFTDPTTAGAIVKAVLQFETLDWWVDEGPTFNLASRANHGRYWRARVGPSGLQETGPQVDRMYNAVVVSYNDITGIARTVGPTGSGADTIDDTLADADATNPVNVAGLDRPYEYPNIGTSTAGAAIAVGRRWLAEMKQASTSGQANIVGYVQDDRAVWYPAWAMRAGDWISFTDAHDTSWRRIVKTTYSDSSKSCQLDLDSPSEDLDAMLARMSVAIAALGFK